MYTNSMIIYVHDVHKKIKLPYKKRWNKPHKYEASKDHLHFVHNFAPKTPGGELGYCFW